MRKLMALTAICMLAASTPSWALFGLGDVKFDGSLEVSGNSANNETDFGGAANSTTGNNDHRGRTATRVRLGANFLVTEGVNGRLELIRDSRQYGDTGSTSGTSVTQEEGFWVFHNAYVDIADLFGAGLDARLGRQYVGNPGDLIWNISPTDDDSLTANSIQGLLLTYNKLSFVNLSAFTGKVVEDDALANTDAGDVTGDVNLGSVDAVFPTIIPNGKINIGYVFGSDSNAASSTDDNHMQTLRLGVNGSVAENMFTYRAEFFQNMGQFDKAGGTNTVLAQDLKYKGNAIDIGLGVNTPESGAGKFGVRANWLMASGDDNTTDGDDKSFHDFSVMGVNTSDRLLGEIFGKSNTMGGGTPLGRGINSADATSTALRGTTNGQGLEVMNLGVTWMPGFSKKTNFMLDWFKFDRAEDSVTTGAGKVKVGDSFGSEIDAAIQYNQSDNVVFNFGWAMFSPDDALTGGANNTNVNDDAVTKLFARTTIKWGGEAQ